MGRDHGRADPTLASRAAYVTGSTLKTFTIAAALAAHAIDVNATVECARRTYGKSDLSDGTPHGALSVTDVLVTSSNVGASRIYDTVGFERFVGTLRKFHFGEAPGSIPNVSDRGGFDAAMLAIGESAEATPLQVAAGYAAIVNGGTYFAPTQEAGNAKGERVVGADTAETMAKMLENAVTSEMGTGKLARLEGARVAGKTGTAQIDDAGHVYASFVGTVLDRSPRLITLVGLESPREGGNGPSAAAPVFARITRRLLAGTERH